MALPNITATAGIVTTRIGFCADVGTGCPHSGVTWISERWRGPEFYLHNGYHSHSSPIIPGKSCCTWSTHSSRVFPHKLHSGNLITTCSVSSMHIIAAATEVKVLSRPIVSATSAPAISKFQNHLLAINHMTQIWYARNFVPGRPGIEYFWPWTESSIHWSTRWAFSSLTALSRHSGTNSLLIMLRTVFNTDLDISGSRSSSPSTGFWTSLAPCLVVISFSMITFSFSVVSWGYGLLLWRS